MTATPPSIGPPYWQTCPTCGRPLRRHTCWTCGTAYCRVCGVPTGYTLLIICAPCALTGAAERVAATETNP